MGKRYIERVTKQMPKCSEEFVSSRKEEIINACASLYETMGFREITLGDIGEKTSFTRTSIYNYFQTKEEIFLALLQREHEAWASDLEDIYRKNDALTAAGFADAVARSLEKRECMLKLMAMNLYDLEGGSRMENLVAFKKSAGRDALPGKIFPADDRRRQTGIPVYAFSVSFWYLSLYLCHPKAEGSHGDSPDPASPVFHL